MPFTLTFEIAGEEQIKRSFSRFADNVSNATEPFKEISEDFKKIEQKQFDSEGSYGGQGWAKLSTNYAEWKAKNYPGAKILVQSGLMKGSLMGENPYYLENIQPLYMEVGTRIPWAIYHQTGGGKLPQRKIINLTEADKTRWVKIFQAWLVREENKQWAGLMPQISAGEKAIGSI